MITLDHTLMVAAIAMAIEAAIGYPSSLFAAFGHPVAWIGFLITALEAEFNLSSASVRSQRLAGIVALLGIVGIPVAVATLTLWGCAKLPVVAAVAVQALLASSLLAQRSLYDHVQAVAAGLDHSLDQGRQAVARIVGRNPETLDRAGIARAAIESLAENSSDGVIAPALWLALAGLPGGVMYKAANTADSMIGHRTPRYQAFGWAAARFDDLLNLPAARLTALLIVLAALITPGASAGGALRAAWRDAGRHRSPNAGWPEAAMAGALGLRLAGPRIYGQTRIEDAWMGDGRAEATAADIGRALALYRRMVGVGLGLLAGTAALSLFY
ncbi:Cobalamin biosynthesis protein CobD [uncultured Gammaproteobacteria bacterium]